MDSAKAFSVISLASATTVASFMALMIIRGAMPLIQMAPFIGLNGAIVGALFYLGIDSISSFSGKKEPKIVMIRNTEGKVISIREEEEQEEEGFLGLFNEAGHEEASMETSLSHRLGLHQTDFTSTIKTILFVVLLLEAYIGAVYASNNLTPLMVVTTNSMKPTINPGDLIYVKGVLPSEIQIGDIITFKAPKEYIKGNYITHRVVEIVYIDGELTFKTKGDNNQEVDPWIVHADDVVGRQTMLIPMVGGLLLWVKTPSGIITLGMLVGAYLFWPEIIKIIGGKKP